MNILLQVFVLLSGFTWFASARAQQWNSLDNVASATSPEPIVVSAASSSEANQIVQRVLSKRCAHSYTTACLKLDLLSLVDRLATQKSYQLMPSINVVQHNGSEEQEGEARSATSSSETSDTVMAAMAQDGPEAAETRLDGLLLDRVSRYLDTHAISVRLIDDDTLAKMRKVGQEVAEKYSYLSAQSGRGKDKKGGGALLMGLMMMKATLGALGFGAIAGLAGKALLVGLLSMMLSAIVGLKSLTSGGGGKSVTYEIISKPVYSHSNTHSHEHAEGHGGGYGGGSSYGHGRSFHLDQAHDIAYRGQRK